MVPPAIGIENQLRRTRNRTEFFTEIGSKFMGLQAIGAINKLSASLFLNFIEFMLSVL
jgi:hypothetical protein